MIARLLAWWRRRRQPIATRPSWRPIPGVDPKHAAQRELTDVELLEDGGVDRRPPRWLDRHGERKTR